MDYKQKRQYHKMGIALSVLILLITGFTLARIIVFEFAKVETSGRVTRWNGNKAFIKFKVEGRDSVEHAIDLPYLQQKTKLFELNEFTVTYDANQPSFFELPGIYRNAPFGVILLFTMSLVGVALGIYNLKKDNHYHGQNET